MVYGLDVESKNGYQKTCVGERLDSVEELLTILNVFVNIIEGTYLIIS